MSLFDWKPWIFDRKPTDYLACRRPWKSRFEVVAMRKRNIWGSTPHRITVALATDTVNCNEICYKALHYCKRIVMEKAHERHKCFFSHVINTLKFKSAFYSTYATTALIKLQTFNCWKAIPFHLQSCRLCEVKECQLLKRKQRFGALMTSTKGYLPFYLAKTTRWLWSDFESHTSKNISTV